MQQPDGSLPDIFAHRVIVGGIPRAGTTLLRWLLDATNSVVSGPETAFFMQALSTHQGRIARSAQRIDKMLELGTDFVTDAIMNGRDLVPVFDTFMAAYAERAGKSVDTWVEKTPANCDRYVPLAIEDPSLRFISLLRDGRDVVTSFMDGHKGYYISIQRFIEAVRSVMAFDAIAPHLPGAPGHLIIRYESLVQQPDVELQRICEFIGITYDPEALVRYREHSLTRDPSKVRQPKVDGPISTKWIERWRDRKHRDRVAEFMADSRAVELLRASGYES